MYGIIDIGSNTIRLKIYKIENEKLVNVIDKKNFLRLISFRRNNVLLDEGIDKCIEVLNNYKHILELLKVSKYYIIAETVLRGLDNIDDVLEKIKALTSFDVVILSSDEEEMYSYLGATNDIDCTNGCVVDIGGGSTELIFFNNKNIEFKSMILNGSLNMQDAYFNEDNLLDFEASGIKNSVKSSLENNKIYNKAKTIIGVGGTIRALLRLKRSEDSLASSFSYDDVRRWYQTAKHNQSLWLKTLLKVSPDRVYTLTSGLIILKTIMKWIDSDEVIVSENGVREGFLYHNIK